MSDALCVFMGILDIIAGILIVFAFGIKLLPAIFGLMMIFKGTISFF